MHMIASSLPMFHLFESVKSYLSLNNYETDHVSFFYRLLRAAGDLFYLR